MATIMQFFIDVLEHPGTPGSKENDSSGGMLPLCESGKYQRPHSALWRHHYMRRKVPPLCDLWQFPQEQGAGFIKYSCKSIFIDFKTVFLLCVLLQPLFLLFLSFRQFTTYSSLSSLGCKVHEKVEHCFFAALPVLFESKRADWN